MIELNKDYPCDYKFYECPLIVSDFKPSIAQISAYRIMLTYYDRWVEKGLSTYQNLADLADEFLLKFYPDANYRYNPDRIATSVNLPFIAYAAGKLYVDWLVNEVENYEEFMTFCERSRFWFEVTKAASCEMLESEEAKNSCNDRMNGINFYDLAERWLAILKCE